MGDLDLDLEALEVVALLPGLVVEVVVPWLAGPGLRRRDDLDHLGLGVGSLPDGGRGVGLLGPGLALPPLAGVGVVLGLLTLDLLGLGAGLVVLGGSGSGGHGCG